MGYHAILPLCDTMGYYPKLLQTTPNYSKLLQTIPNYSKLYKNRSQTTRNYPKLPQYKNRSLTPLPGLPEINDGTELGQYELAGVVPAMQIFDCVGGVVFLGELDVDVAHDVLAQVVADDHFVHLAVLRHLFFKRSTQEDFLVEVLEVAPRLLGLLLGHVLPLRHRQLDRRLVVHVRHQDRHPKLLPSKPLTTKAACSADARTCLRAGKPRS